MVTIPRWRSGAAIQLINGTGQPDPIVAMQMTTAKLIDEASQEGPRIDLDVVGSFQDIESIVECRMVSAGRLVPTTSGHLRVEVNKDHLHEKQRFTIAHEICHTLLPTYRQQLVEDHKTGTFPEGNSDAREEELLCDVGAASLLMDARFLRRYLQRFALGVELLQRVARDFDVSLHATTRRIAELAEEPMAYVIWERSHSMENFSVAHFYPSSTYSPEMHFMRGAVCTEESPIGWTSDDRRKRPVKQNWSFSFNPNIGEVRLYTESFSAPYLGNARVVSFVRPSKYRNRSSKNL